jgi:hypothetical protein
VKDFFQKAPEHEFVPGDIVTCTCHGGVALIVRLYDELEVSAATNDVLSMNMVQIYWLKYPHDGVKERLWLHTIDRLYIFKGN